MAISLVDTAYDGPNFGTSVSCDVTISGSDKFLLICVAYWSNDSVDSVDVDGDTSAALLHASRFTNGSDSNQHIEIYGLAAPADGAPATVTVTMTGFGAFGVSLAVASYTGVDQTMPAGTATSNSGNSKVMSLSLSSASGRETAAMYFHRFSLGAVSDTGDQTTQESDDDGSHFFGFGTAAGAASVSHEWTGGGFFNRAWLVGGVEIYPVGGAPGGGETEIEAAAATLTLTANDVTITKSVEILVEQETLVLTSFSPNITYDIQPPVTTLSLISNPANLGIDVQSASATLALTSNTASVGSGNEVTANLESIALQSYAALITHNLAANVASLGVSANAATIGQTLNLPASIASLSLTDNTATIGLSVNILSANTTITLTSYGATIDGTPSISVGTRHIRSIAPIMKKRYLKSMRSR